MSDRAEEHARLEAEVMRLREELASQADVVTLGDATLGLMHALSNSLNVMSLQASVVQLKVDAALREELAVIRRESALAAQRLHRLQEFRDASRQARRAIDLNQLLRDAAARIPGLDGRVRFQLQTDLAPLNANQPALWRLFLHLLGQVAATEGAIMIQSGQKDQKIQILVEPFPDRQSAETLVDLFASADDVSNRHGALVGLAADSLARLVEARCRIESRSQGGLRVILEWTTA